MKLVLMLVICVTLLGCAQTKQYTPQQATAQYTLPNLPANLIRVQVNDLRPDVAEADGLADVLRTQIESALSDIPGQGEPDSYSLLVDIIDHRAFFTLGNWNASTKFRIKLMRPDDTVIDQWDAEGDSRRSNMFGYATAKAVSQDSYNIALADMMSSLSPVSIRK